MWLNWRLSLKCRGLMIYYRQIKSNRVTFWIRLVEDRRFWGFAQESQPGAPLKCCSAEVLRETTRCTFGPFDRISGASSALLEVWADVCVLLYRATRMLSGEIRGSHPLLSFNGAIGGLFRARNPHQWRHFTLTAAFISLTTSKGVIIWLFSLKKTKKPFVVCGHELWGAVDKLML